MRHVVFFIKKNINLPQHLFKNCILLPISVRSLPANRMHSGLFIHSLTEFRVRKALKERNETVPNPEKTNTKADSSS